MARPSSLVSRLLDMPLVVDPFPEWTGGGLERASEGDVPQLLAVGFPADPDLSVAIQIESEIGRHATNLVRIVIEALAEVP